MSDSTQPIGDVLGTSIPRLEGPEKITGRALFTDDMKLPGMLYGAVLRSPHAHARILAYDIAVAAAVPGVHGVITGEDFTTHRFGSFVRDEHPLAQGRVRYIGEPVAAVAADDLHTAQAAAKLIEVDYEELPAVMEIDEALADDAPVLHEDFADYVKLIPPATEKNVNAYMDFTQGDVEAAWAECDVIVEGEYRVPAQQHMYMEPCSALADIDWSGNVTVWGSVQGLSGMQTAVAEALELPNAQVRAIVPMVGGGFGAKYEYTVEPLAAKLAQVCQRPVRVTLSRDEDMTMMKSRHRGVIRMKTGAKRDGTLIAREAEVWLDGGAYADESPAVLGFALNRIAGPYRVPHQRARGRAVYTNRLRGGAFRGFGNPQATFAGESQLDDLAAKLDMDPIELRINNAMQTGDPWIGGSTIEVGSLTECLEAVRDAADWTTRREQPAAGGNGKRRGLGVAAVWHICGLLGASADVRLLEDGSVSVSCGAVDIGEGADTALAQICAGVLGLPMERINYVRPDTDASPHNFKTSGSRTTFMVGRSVWEASMRAREQMFEAAAAMMECAAEDLELEPGGMVQVKGVPGGTVSFHDICGWSLFKGDGEIHGTNTWTYQPMDVDPKRAASEEGYSVGANTFGAQIVEVTVDEVTGGVEVTRAWAAHDVGKAINPAAVEGQIQGGVVQGMGYALTEELLWEGGHLINPTLMDYKVPGLADSPPDIQSIIIERPHPQGPFGAKGIAESSLVGIAPAMTNAIYQATGVRIEEIPLTGERVLRALMADG